MIVSIAPTWNSASGRLMCFERRGDRWIAATGSWPVLYGREGLAWGSGIKGQREPGVHKREGDGRAPAGIFRLGKIYGYAPRPPSGVQFPYHQVTERDAWIDDVQHPQYNRHVMVDPRNPPPWFDSQRMRLGDPAYRWLVEIRHNADPPVPGAGSAIFFHIRRGVNRPTSGCTTMAELDLLNLMRWLRHDGNPHYVLLPWPKYRERWSAWGLPDPGRVRELTPKNPHGS